ncbi:hypothetical protein FQ185_11795 [Pseudomonas sp. ANT_H12B]|nr:hypothetical protein FQ185_11795 [Pseudomonas sp. ANT_H12B]
MIVPTLRVGMQPGTLRVPFRAERGASVDAFPRRAWERSSSTGFPAPCSAPAHSPPVDQRAAARCAPPSVGQA